MVVRERPFFNPLEVLTIHTYMEANLYLYILIPQRVSFEKVTAVKAPPDRANPQLWYHLNLFNLKCIFKKFH